MDRHWVDVIDHDGTWYRVEIEWDSDDNNGDVHVYVDGDEWRPRHDPTA